MALSGGLLGPEGVCVSESCYSLKNEALLSFMSIYLKDKFFDKMRTHEQLGYIVWSTERNDAGLRSMIFIIQAIQNIS